MSSKAFTHLELPTATSISEAPRTRSASSRRFGKYFKAFGTAVLTATLAATAAFADSAATTSAGSSVKLLTANFESREVAQVEVGDFHFAPGQVAPIHTHRAPAVGYVAKGMIIYQIEGQRPRILREGDAFYELVGPRILRFDNASATEEAIFVDFNLEQVDEPFIVFEEQPTQAIDRRTLPTVSLGGKSVEQVDVYANELQGGEELPLEISAPTLGLVTEGVIELRVNGEPTKRIVAGGSFSLPTGDSKATIVNASPEVSAKVITFRLR